MKINEIIRTKKIIAIVRNVNENKIKDTVQALYSGGIRLVEVTFDQTSNTCIKDTIKNIKMIRDAFKDKICVGAGTVMSKKQVCAAIDAGAKYMISPNTDRGVIEETKKWVLFPYRVRLLRLKL